MFVPERALFRVKGDQSLWRRAVLRQPTVDVNQVVLLQRDEIEVFRPLGDVLAELGRARRVVADQLLDAAHAILHRFVAHHLQRQAPVSEAVLPGGCVKLGDQG